MQLRGRVSAWMLVSALGLSGLTWSGEASAAGNKPTPKEERVSLYIQIINSESEHVFSNYDRYTKRLKDPQKGPTCTETGPQSWISSMGPSAPDRYKGWRKALSKKPKVEMDETAGEMLDALEALYEPGNEASEYFFKSKFKQDSCKRAGELHGVLMSGWTKYMRAEQAMRVFLDKYTDERDQKELVDTQKKYGKAFHYYHRKLMVDAKALIRVADRQDPDLAAVREKLAVFEPTLNEAKALDEKERKGKLRDALYQGGYEQMLTHAGWFRDATNEVIRVVENEAKDPKAASRTNARPTAMKNLINSYNGLVEQSNKVMYSKAMK
ncbi:MAG: DUF3829 domain-containing protein [Myxococcota bacterium]